MACERIAPPLNDEQLIAGEKYLATWKHEDYASPKTALLELMELLVAAKPEPSPSD
jgi:hypothetical protein